MRIMHLTQFLGIGGLEKVLLTLMKEQIRAGHDVELFVYDYEQTWVPYFKSHGIKVNNSFRKQQGYDWKLLNYLDETVDNFDVVHTHDINPLMYMGPLKLMRMLQDKRTPKIIHTAHGMEHLERRPLLKLYEHFCTKLVHRVVGVGPQVCHDYVNRIFLDLDKVKKIENGIGLQDQIVMNRHLAKEKLKDNFGLPQEKPIWVYVARVVPLKNQKLLIDVARRRPELTLLLVGPSGEENYWSSIHTDLPPNVITTGGQENILEILLGSDFYISSSTHEGIPISVLEAGALGLPCLLSDIPGHRSVQANASVPVVEFFKLHNVEELITKMKKMEEDTVRSEALGAGLKNWIKANFSSEAMSNKYLEVYRS